MLSEGPPILCMHLRKIMKYFSSDGYLSLQYTAPFPVHGGYQNLEFGVQFDSWQLALMKMT